VDDKLVDSEKMVV